VLRLVGILTAMSVFLWRYINVSENWAYVASWRSIALLRLTLIPEIAYPFTYKKVEKDMQSRRAIEKKSK
jgi:hypothetical protein